MALSRIGNNKSQSNRTAEYSGSLAASLPYILLAMAEHIFGKNSVLSLLENPGGTQINKILIASGLKPDKRVDTIQQLARKLKIPVQSCDRRKIEQILTPGDNHQGILAMLSPVDLLSFNELLDRIDADSIARQKAGSTMDGYMLVLVDRIEDPHNLGAIIRVAESAGAKALMLPDRRSASITGTVAKVSAGAVASLPIVSISNSVAALNALKDRGFWVVGLDVRGKESYSRSDLVRPLAVVIGSEGKGMSKLVRETCDFLVQIPMLGRTESLNASVAAGILLYEAVRQCQEKGILSET